MNNQDRRIVDVGACSLGLVGLVALGGCFAPAGEEPLATEVASAEQAIIDGEECSGWVKDSIVAIGGPYTNRLRLPDTLKCSGTLIAPNLVVTARHCVSQFSDAEWPCNSEGQANWPFFDPPDLEDVYIYNDFDECPLAKVVDVVTLPDDHVCNNDVVFLVLDHRVTGKTSAPIRGTPVQPSETFTMAGFGFINNEGDLPQTCMQRLVNVESAPPPKGYEGEAYDVFGVYQGDWEIVTDPGNCTGDSGGPLFDADQKLAGTVSRFVTPSLIGLGCEEAHAGIHVDLFFHMPSVIAAKLVAAIRRDQPVPIPGRESSGLLRPEFWERYNGGACEDDPDCSVADTSETGGRLGLALGPVAQSDGGSPAAASSVTGSADASRVEQQDASTSSVAWVQRFSADWQGNESWLIQSPGQSEVFWLHGDMLDAWTSSYGGAAGCLGWPLSNVIAYDDPNTLASDRNARKVIFQHGVLRYEPGRVGEPYHAPSCDFSAPCVTALADDFDGKALAWTTSLAMDGVGWRRKANDPVRINPFQSTDPFACVRRPPAEDCTPGEPDCVLCMDPTDAACMPEPGAVSNAFSGAYAYWFGHEGESRGNYLPSGGQCSAQSGGGGGPAVEGVLTSAEFVVPDLEPMLEFRSWWEVESAASLTQDPGGNNDFGSDQMRVKVIDSTGGVTVLGTENPDTGPTGFYMTARSSGGFDEPPRWTARQYELSAFRGQTIRVEFEFEAFDNTANAFRGWMIDDVFVRSAHCQ